MGFQSQVITKGLDSYKGGFHCIFDFLQYRGSYLQVNDWRHYDVNNNRQAVIHRIKAWRKNEKLYKNMVIDGVELTYENMDATLLVMGLV